MTDRIVHQRQVPLPGRGYPADFFDGGDGPALLLLHGGWGDASLHWSCIWEQLAEHHRVVAPELPGFGPEPRAGCATVHEYVDWLAALLDELGIERACCVGNSFGASLAWSFAGRLADRCTGLVMVNGPPMPKTPAPMLWLGRKWIGRALMRAIFGTVAFHPRSVRLAFVDPRHLPAGHADKLAQRRDHLLPHFVDLLIEGDGPPAPRVAPLLLWGADDRLPQTGERAAHRLHASLPGSTLRLIRGAGHFPQLEAPDEFVRQLLAFIQSS